MNILLSYNWLKEFVDVKLAPKQLATLLSLHSMSVEKILPEIALLGDKIVLGEILEVKAHPNADKLQLATVTDGKNRYPVVCGAPNIKKGMKIAFALPGAMVRWHGEGEPVELQPAKIRGEESEGMICDNSEIGLADKPDPKGIADYSHLKAKVGTTLAKALGLNDTIFDIEITTNRIDAASVLGMAREVSAVTGARMTPPSIPPLGRGGKELYPIQVIIEDKESCHGFHAVILDGISVGPSPDWLQRKLRASGFEPINNVVDVTNYVMHELGHPLHAFDYDKVVNGKLLIRQAKKGEKLTMLDGKEVKMDSTMPVVADERQALALAGVMGGQASAISTSTQTVLLEAASWNKQVIRKTAMKLDKFTDASSYFAKGVSPQQAEVAFLRAVELLKEVAGAKVASKHIMKGYKAYKPKTVQLDLARAQQLIGAKLSSATVKRQLTALGFTVKAKKDSLACTVPHWRQDDVAIEEDLIEEVARLHGYQNIENKLPSGEIPFPTFDKHLAFEQKLKNLMKGAGYTELYTYSLVSEQLLSYARNGDKALKLLNPLDDEHAYMRTGLLPSLLEVAAQNQGIVPSQNLFEIANVYLQEKKNELPRELTQMAGVLVGEDRVQLFRRAKGIVEAILKTLGLSASLAWEANPTQFQYAADALAARINGEELGVVGSIRSDIAKAFGLKKDTVVFRLDLEQLIALAHPKMTYTPLPKFPPVELDLSIVVPASVPWDKVNAVVRQEGAHLLREIELFDIYDLNEHEKSFGFHLAFRSDEKTLEMNEVEALQKNIVEKLGKELGAKLR